MACPSTSHTNSRIQFDQPREYIIAKLKRIPRIGTRGTSGVLNGRFTSGFFTRITQTPAQTITNANNVPMLVMCPTMISGRNAEKGATKKKNSRFERHGVWNFGWISEKTLGTKPSRDME